jgi:hypothetical protein
MPVSVIPFPSPEAPPDDIVRLETALASVARAVTLSLQVSTNAILAANTPAELAAAVNAMHDVLVTHGRNFEELVDATRHWR